MLNDKIPDDHHIVRTVPFARLRKKDGTEDEVVGILPDAFKMRDTEDYLSASWLEFHGGDRECAKTALVQALRESSFKPSTKSGFAIGNVGAIKAACNSRKHQVRIVHHPEDDNQAHVAVRRLPRDEYELLEILASSAWSELFLNKEIPEKAPPVSTCEGI